MEAKELRIGNYINDTSGEDLPVTAIFKNEVKVKGYKYKCLIEDCDPIELMPEILEKCGAIKPYDDESEFYQIGVFDFKYENDALLLWDRESNSIMFGTKPLQWLHSLQNLIFAITQTELQINL